MRKVETIAVVFSLLFMIAISLYHVSCDGFLGLSNLFWESLWAMSNNGLMLTMSFLIMLYSWGVLRLLIIWVFIPYFTIKLIYQFSVYSEVYLISPKAWEGVWSFTLVFVIIAALFITLTKIRNA
jgi:hypothetical protein